MPAPTPSPHTPTPGPRDPSRARGAGRLLVGGIALAVGATAVVSLTDLRDADIAAAATTERAAAHELIGEVTDTRLALDDHARGASAASSVALRHHVDVLAGGDHDPDRIAATVEQLRDHAAELEQLATADVPERPRAVPVALADPILERLRLLQEQAAELAATAHHAADEAAELDAALAALQDATVTYAEGTALTSSDDPAAVASTWRDERSALTELRGAIDAIADDHDVALGPLLDAHHTFIDALDVTAERAVELLERGDLDGYAELLEDRLGGDDLAGTREALREGRDTVTARVLDGPGERVRAAALGLRVELGDLRDELPELLRG